MHNLSLRLVQNIGQVIADIPDPTSRALASARTPME